MEVKPIAWSHSRVADYKACQKMFYHKNVLKDIPFVKTVQMEQGELVHKMFELRIGSSTPFPHGYSSYEAIALPIIKAPGQAYTEFEMTLTEALTPTGWFSKDAWCRVKIDVMKINGNRGFAGDWKTGKIKFDEHQLKLTAAVMMTQFTELEQVATAFIWLRDGVVDKKTYTRDQLAVLWEELLVVPRQMQESNATGNWPARPSHECKWCPVNKLGKCSAAGHPYKGS